MSGSETPIGEASVLPLTSSEIALLRDGALAKKRSFLKDYPFLLSVLAFLLSLSTSMLSIYATHRRDITDRRSQLSSAIQQIQDLNLKQVEVYDKYKGTQYESQAGGLITAQLNNTLAIAKDLALNLGSDGTTAAFAVVGQGLMGTGDFAGAQRIFEIGLTTAQTAADESIALRNLATIKMRVMNTPTSFEDGEQLLLRASSLERKYDLRELPGTIAWLKASAKLHWAGLIAPQNCSEARHRLAEAETALAIPMQNIDLDQLRRAIQFQAANGIGGVAECKVVSPGPT